MVSGAYLACLRSHSTIMEAPCCVKEMLKMHSALPPLGNKTLQEKKAKAKNLLK